jgi:hypothetical protein
MKSDARVVELDSRIGQKLRELLVGAREMYRGFGAQNIPRLENFIEDIDLFTYSILSNRSYLSDATKLRFLYNLASVDM